MLRQHFLMDFPRIKTGRYAHIFTLQKTDSLAVFRTEKDGDLLNFCRIQAGVTETQAISRIMLIKRKQTTPERLTGRTLLRELNYISDQANEPRTCRYNDLDLVCGVCPDCVLYGFATGDRGSEKSKIMGDAAYSLSGYANSHMSMQHVAGSESGTIMKDPEKRTPDNLYRGTMFPLDYVSPGVVFPILETLCDGTWESFLFLLRNILATKRHGAIVSSGGVMEKRVVAIALTNAEIFSNLRLTQLLYDEVGEGKDVPFSELAERLGNIIPQALAQEPCQTPVVLTGAALQTFLEEVMETFRDPTKLTEVMEALQQQCQTYAENYGILAARKKKK